MDFQKLSMNRVDFTRFEKAPREQYLFINIILIDTAHDEVPATAYQLIDDDNILSNALINGETSHLATNHDFFSVLGIVSNIDKKERKITLIDGSEIKYKHMIICSSTHFSCTNHSLQEHEFITGLQSLLEAIRIQKKLSQPTMAAQKISQASKEKPKTNFTTTPQLPKQIEQLLAMLIANYTLEPKTGSLPQSYGRRNFEIQL